MPACRFTDEQVQAMYERAKAGEPVRQVALEYGAAPANLSSMLKRRYGYVPGYYRTATLNLPNDPAVLAYIAALVDGEGSIKKDRDSWVVVIGMTHQGVIEWLHSFGGNYHTNKLTAGRKQIYTWSVKKQHDVNSLLRAIAPYMRVKRDKALSVLQEVN